MKKQYFKWLTLVMVISTFLLMGTMCSPNAETPTINVENTPPSNEMDATDVEGDHTHDEEHQTSSLSPVSLKDGEKLQVVATTSLIHDVVANIGGDLIDLTLLIPVGSDPHGFEARPQDMVRVTDAHVVFANGVGLEATLEPLFESAGAVEKTIQVSNGIDLIKFEGGEDEHEEEEEEDHHHDEDPHTWTDPNNVKIWVDNIEHALSTLDPNHAEQFEANAQAYQQSLDELDSWIRDRVSEIPEKDRLLVTDHLLFGYFAQEYGLEQIGAVVPGYSSLAEPSAQELAALEDAIQQYQVNAILVGNTVNPNLAETVAQDTGTKLVTIYTGSLSDEDGDAPTYLDYVRYNVNAIVDGLK